MPKTSGTFDVRMTPAEKRNRDDLPNGLFLLEKNFQGGIEGTSYGEVLTAFGAVQGSAAYTAIEKVTGTLDGREGSFFLAHKGVMSAGGQQQDITVIPDSGTDALKGLSGTFLIINEDGKHSYEFDYSLPDTSG